MTTGITIDLTRVDPNDAVTLARRAEELGLELVVLGSGPGSIDPWTAVVWIAARTDRITLGIEPPGPAHDRSPTPVLTDIPAVAATSVESLEGLAGARMVDVGTWSAADLVPATSLDDVDVAAQASAGHDPDTAARSLAQLARRHRGVDYDGVPESLRTHAVEPGDPAYRSVASTYMRGGSPALVLRPRTPDEVSDAVGFARRHRSLPLGIRSGGHGISGRSTNRGGLVIDVGALDDITVLDASRRLVRVGPGATWKQLSRVLHPYGWAIGSGDYGGVGVGGLATAGGIGFLSREQGLTIDRVRAVELVLADGSQVRASETANPDLFWAARGAGANMGIATAFELEAAPVGDVAWAQLVLVVPDLERALVEFGAAASAAPRDTTLFLLTGAPRGGQAVIQLYGVVDSSQEDVILQRLGPFARIGALVQQDVRITSYAEVMATAADVGPDGHGGFGDPTARSTLVDELTPRFAHEVAAMLRTGAVYFFQLRTMGGAIGDAPADATAFAHRSAAFSVAAMGRSAHELDPVWRPVRALGSGMYLSFETDRSPEGLREAFGDRTLTRLRELKQRYDPEVLFSDNFAIDPAPAPTTTGAP